MPDPGVNLLILYFELSSIQLIFLSFKLQKFNNVLPLVAAPSPTTILFFYNACLKIYLTDFLRKKFVY